MSAIQKKNTQNVFGEKTNGGSVETDKNAGENANDLLPFKYEQTLTER